MVEPEALRVKKLLAEKSPPLVAALIRLLAWTLRFRLEDPENIFGRDLEKPRIFAFWHNRILMMPFLYEKYCPGRRMLMMVSRSRDGELITQVMNRFGVDGARGSTERGRGCVKGDDPGIGEGGGTRHRDYTGWATGAPVQSAGRGVGGRRRKRCSDYPGNDTGELEVGAVLVGSLSDSHSRSGLLFGGGAERPPAFFHGS